MRQRPRFFIVTDEALESEMRGGPCPNGGDPEEVGDFADMGEQRGAFDEESAKMSIEAHGFYRFEAPGMAAVPPRPGDALSRYSATRTRLAVARPAPDYSPASL